MLNKTTRKTPLVFRLLLMSLCCINLLYMHYSVLLDRTALTKFSYIENLCYILVDVCIVFSIPLLFIRKRNYLFFIPYAFVCLFSIANIWYSRYFYTYLPPTLYAEFNNLDGLSANVTAAFHTADLLLVCTTAIAILFYWKYRKVLSTKKSSAIKLSLSAIGTAILIIILMIGIAKINWPRLEYKFIHPFKNSPTECTFKFGMLYNTAMQVLFNHKEEYSEDELQMLKPYFYAPINKTEGNHPENLIFIIVESLLTYPTQLTIDGEEITPTLNRLVKEGAYYNSNMSSQAQLGQSSDGQFTYLTGLLPRKEGVTIIDYFDNKFVTVPMLLKNRDAQCNNSMIIPTSSKTWRQDGICMKYMIENLYSRKDYPDKSYKESWLNDRLLFKFATEVSGNKVPFCSILLTSSTHTPFEKEYETNQLAFPETYSKELQVYLSNIHYMDKYLGSYIEALKEKGIFDNTLIVIASDHNLSTDWFHLKDGMRIPVQIPLYIINSPVNIEKKSDYPITQTDVFPTILDLMGIQSKWRGVGNSLLTPDSILNSRQELARKEKRQQISDIILNSDYFNRNNQ